MTHLHRCAFDHAHQTRQLRFEFLRHRRGFQKTLQLAGGFSPLLGRIFAGNVNNTVQTLLFIRLTNSVAFQISEICPLEDVPASRRRGVFLRPQRLPRKFLLAAGCCCRGKGVGVPGCERSSADATHVQAGQRRTWRMPKEGLVCLDMSQCRGRRRISRRAESRTCRARERGLICRDMRRCTGGVDAFPGGPNCTQTPHLQQRHGLMHVPLVHHPDGRHGGEFGPVRGLDAGKRGVMCRDKEKGGRITGKRGVGCGSSRG